MKQASVSAYPLQWPMGVPRSLSWKREKSKFGKRDWNVSLKMLTAELSRLGASYVTISTNQKLRQDGLPYAQQIRIDDEGVAVYFTLEGAQICFPCDRWTSIAENLYAITLHIEAMRGQQRWGVGTAKQAFAGYRALTAVAGEGEDPFLVLGVEETASVEEIRVAHRELAKTAHPDRSGSTDQMSRINTARDRALGKARER